MNGVDLGAVWKRALTNFLNENVPAQQRTWLSMVRPIALADDTIVLGVPNDFLKDLIERKLRPLVAHALSQELGRAMRLAVMIDTTAPEQPMQSMQEHHPQPGGQSYPQSQDQQPRYTHGAQPQHYQASEPPQFYSPQPDQGPSSTDYPQPTFSFDQAQPYTPPVQKEPEPRRTGGKPRATSPANRPG